MSTRHETTACHLRIERAGIPRLHIVEFFLTMCCLSSPAVAKNEDTPLSPNDWSFSHATLSQKTRITYADHAVVCTAGQG